jgi:murein DD-endopeptidase MepM/ murein hydrolase activator NlpD
MTLAVATLSLVATWLFVDDPIRNAAAGGLVDGSASNLQTLTLTQPSQGIESTGAVGGPAIEIVGEAAVVAPQSPNIGEAADFNGATANSKQASIYVVREGDTLGEVAELFDVSVNTVVWANDISGETISPEDVLVILPMSGVRHEVEEGDTLEEIVEHYGGDLEDVRDYNQLNGVDDLAVGAIIDIPGGVMPAAPRASQPASSPRPVVSRGAVTTRSSAPVSGGFLIHPVPGSVVTQGLHGYNAVDLAASRGSSVISAASGRVTKSVGGGWNGGYGQFIVVAHDNGTKALYSHLSGVIVSRGQRVVQGQVIGYVGSTGRSSGNHLHFEVRGAANPFN